MTNPNTRKQIEPEEYADLSPADALSEVCRQGAIKMLAVAVENEADAFIERYKDLRDEIGRRQVVRNGHLPEREIQTGVGQVPVKMPRVRDKSGSGIRFTSNILPPYLRRTKSIEELIPWLYLKGISTGDFAEALQSLLGPDAPGLSANTVVRLKTSGKTNMKNGTGAISPANATSTSGPTASTFRPAWRRSSACW